MERFGEKMFGLELTEYGRQFWTYCKSKKAQTCRECSADLEPGRGVWRPTTNQGNRGDRVCSIECLQMYEANH